MTLFNRLNKKEIRKEQKMREERVEAIKDSYDEIDSELADIGWSFDKKRYSKADFEAKLERVKEETYGGQWDINKLDQKLAEPEILVTYQCWLDSRKQLLDNEWLTDEDALKDEQQDDSMSQVTVEADLKADNGEYFLTDELLMKLQNQLANKELGDDVFLEGFEYQGEKAAKDSDSRNLPVFNVVTGD